MSRCRQRTWVRVELSGSSRKGVRRRPAAFLHHKACLGWDLEAAGRRIERVAREHQDPAALPLDEGRLHADYAYCLAHCTTSSTLAKELNLRNVVQVGGARLISSLRHISIGRRRVNPGAMAVLNAVVRRGLAGRRDCQEEPGVEPFWLEFRGNPSRKRRQVVRFDPDARFFEQFARRGQVVRNRVPGLHPVHPRNRGRQPVGQFARCRPRCLPAPPVRREKRSRRP